MELEKELQWDILSNGLLSIGNNEGDLTIEVTLEPELGKEPEDCFYTISDKDRQLFINTFGSELLNELYTILDDAASQHDFSEELYQLKCLHAEYLND